VNYGMRSSGPWPPHRPDPLARYKARRTPAQEEGISCAFGSGWRCPRDHAGQRPDR